MERIEHIQKIKEETIHRFYCDRCKELIIESCEFDDGYYAEPNPVEIKACCFGKWYILKKGIYCEDCKPLIQQEIIRELKNIGFRTDEE